MIQSLLGSGDFVSSSLLARRSTSGYCAGCPEAPTLQRYAYSLLAHLPRPPPPFRPGFPLFLKCRRWCTLPSQILPSSFPFLFTVQKWDGSRSTRNPSVSHLEQATALSGNIQQLPANAVLHLRGRRGRHRCRTTETKEKKGSKKTRSHFQPGCLRNETRRTYEHFLLLGKPRRSQNQPPPAKAYAPVTVMSPRSSARFKFQPPRTGTGLALRCTTAAEPLLLL
jgi:hypothetical protein